MIAVDDRQGSDAAGDGPVSGLRVRRPGAAPVDVEQRGDDLEVVLDAVMDLPDQPALAGQSIGHLALRLLDLRDGASERIAQSLDLGRRADVAGQVQTIP